MSIFAINFKVKGLLSTVSYYSQEMPTPRLVAWFYFMTKKAVYIWLYPAISTDISSTFWPILVAYFLYSVFLKESQKK